MRNLPRLIALGSLLACAHTDPYATGDLPLRGPLEEPGFRLTYHQGLDSAYAWSADGNSIAYSYNSSCIGILSRTGGTRQKEMCDTRSAPGAPDFRQEVVSAVAQGPDQRVIFFQTAFINSLGLPYGGILISADTSAPLEMRKILLTLPQTIGDSVVQALTDLQWTGPDAFIAIAHRIIGSTFDPLGGSRLIRNPRMLVRGEIANDRATFSKIPGTDNAASWAIGANRTILFTRGEWMALAELDTLLGSFTPDNSPSFVADSAVFSVPMSGGAPTRVAVAPFGLYGLSCIGSFCAVFGQELICPTACTVVQPAGALFRQWNCITRCFSLPKPLQLFYQYTGRLLPFPGAQANWKQLRFSPTRNEFIYVQNGDLFRRQFTLP